MIHVRFDMNDSRVVYGNPNLRWGNPSVLLEPSDPGYTQLAPGTPGYQAPLSPKPKRHRTISLASLNLPNNMQPFRYIIQLISALFTSRPAARPAMGEGEYLDTIATRSALTRAQVEKVITEMSGLHVELTRQTIPVDFILKRFRIQPVCGGRLSGPDPSDIEVRDTLGYSVVIHPDEIDKVRVDCPVEKVGEAAENAPRVTSVRARPGNVANKYAVGPGRTTEVNGANFRDRQTDAPWPTACLVNAAGVLVTAVDVADCTGPTRLILSGAPVGTTGSLYLKLVDADGHFSVWDQELTPHAA